jgi:uncharacterized protein (TIGR02145 family)
LVVLFSFSLSLLGFLNTVLATTGAIDDISIIVPVSCTFSDTTADGSYAVNITPGNYDDSIGSTTFQVFCNDNNGFSVYAVGYSDNQYGNTNMVSSNAGNPDIVTGTATQGNTSNWAMKLNSVAGTYAPTISNGTNNTENFTVFHAVPATYTKVATLASRTDRTTGSSFQSTYRIYVSPIQPPGTYISKVKYTLVHPNDAAKPTTTLEEAYANAGKTKVTLDTNSYYTMQDMNPDICRATVVIGNQLQVLDTRDNHLYYIAKLDDGNCWMTQNLDLCIGCTGTTTLTSQNTDLNTAGSGIYSNGYSTDANGVITWTPSGNATITGTPATIPNFAYSSVSGWSDSNTYPYMAEGSTEYVVQGTPYATRAACVTAKDAVTCDHNHIGNYYNWTAAVASNDSSTITTKYATAANSVCPAGWRLPAGPDGTNGSTFNTLLSAANIANGTDNGSGSSAVNVGYKSGGFNKIESSPYYFARPGFVNGTTLYSFASLGHYWSGSAVSGSNAFNLYYSSSGLYPANQSNRNGGRSLRCVAR